MRRAFKCHCCDQPATRAFCYAGGPWQPYCSDDHGPGGYEPAGDIPIAQLPKAIDVLGDVLKATRTKEDVRYCEAVLEAFEALQAQGIWLSGPDGRVLNKKQFMAAMAVALNAALKALK